MSCADWWTTWSPELAYTLGFIFADGAVRDKHHDVAIVQKDREILDLLFPIVQGENKRIVPSGRGGFALKCRVDNLRHTLAEYGIIPRKTYCGKWCESLPADLVMHYIRGFFDGDGYILEKTDRGARRGWVVGFTCHVQEYIVRLVDEVVARGIPPATIYKSKNDWKVKWHSRDDIIAFRDLLYANATIFLPRKKVMFDDAVNYFAETPLYRGTSRNSNRLTEEQVLEIRRLYALGGTSFVKLAQQFGVGKTTVEGIVKHYRWRWL